MKLRRHILSIKHVSPEPSEMAVITRVQAARVGCGHARKNVIRTALEKFVRMPFTFYSFANKVSSVRQLLLKEINVVQYN